MANEPALEQALAALLEERADIDLAIAALQRRLGRSASVASPIPSLTGDPKIPVALGEIVTHPGEFHQHSLPQALEKILRRAGRPVKTNDLVAALHQAEFATNAKALPQSVYTAMARSKGFVKVRPNTWGLSEWFPSKQATEGEPKRRRRKARSSGPKPVSRNAGKNEQQELQKAV